ncbi:MAG: FtsQ-type POTRA domain-containing protein [Rhodospirillaceae bacterium]|nr:FtsQ-type POTRA domain-containing protein [Rhodospirillaceae bacterium]
MRRVSEAAATARKRQAGGRRRRPLRLLGRRARRIGLASLGGAVVLGGGLWVASTGTLAEAADQVDAAVLAWTGDIGFSVQEVLVYGREETRPIELLAALGIDRGDPILRLDPEAARDQIQSLSWVRRAWVQRRLPDTVIVRVEERRPLALWQHEQQWRLIDDEGHVLGEGDIGHFLSLPQVVGPDAPDHAPAFLAVLAAEPEIAARVAAAVRVGGRRWDLRLDNGVAVHLPEEDVELALHRLARLQRQDGLFERDVIAIDLRTAGHLVIETSSQVRERMLLPEENT